MGQRQGTGCHDRLIELMVGAPSQLAVPGSQMGARTDGRMGRWADEFHKSKRAIPNGGKSSDLKVPQTWGIATGRGEWAKGAKRSCDRIQL